MHLQSFARPYRIEAANYGRAHSTAQYVYVVPVVTLLKICKIHFNAGQDKQRDEEHLCC